MFKQVTGGVSIIVILILGFLKITEPKTDAYYRATKRGTSTGVHYELVTERLEDCIAINEHQIVSMDGNIWEVNDNMLEKGMSYDVVFSDNATPKNVADDIVVKIIK